MTREEAISVLNDMRPKITIPTGTVITLKRNIAIDMAIEALEREERTHGHWVGEQKYPVCNKCKCNIHEKYISCSDYAEITATMNFCPNCGADMRDEINDDYS